MRIKFWGSRGSLPATINSEIIREKLFEALKRVERIPKGETEINSFIDTLPFYVRSTYGTNTPCMEIESDEGGHVICDAGSGLRDLGFYLHNSGKLKKCRTFNIFMSHFHYDHMQGFPFFVPAYQEGMVINIYGCHEDIEGAFRRHQEEPFFPVNFNYLRSEINFIKLQPEKDYKIDGFTVRAIEQKHPGVSYGYRFENRGKAVVYSTDSEHKWDMEEESYPFLSFFKNADLLVFDAMYSYLDAALSKQDWGHSSNITGVELAIRAGVKRLVLFHSEPVSRDIHLAQTIEETRQYAEIYSPGSTLNVTGAYDGLEITI